MQERPPLLVFSDDWGRHPSSCQHLIRCLLRRHEVHWVNTIGMRSPRLNFATLDRALEKVRHWARPGRAASNLPAGLRVANPRMWPWFGSRFSRRLNRALLLRQLKRLILTLPAPPIAITTLPIVADLIGELRVRRWVYYCVDDFGQWPGLDQIPLRQMDDQLITRADVRIAVSETLRDRIRSLGMDAHLLTHGVDLDFWRRGEAAAAVAELAGLERPLIVFWGVVDRRMDVSFVQRLASDLTAGTIVLAGPKADPDPALFESGRVVPIGSLPFEQLPHLASEASVLIMPYADLPVTRAMQPLKLKEYLATGKSVVVRDLPANREWQDCLDLVNDPQSFAQRVMLRTQTGVPEKQVAARIRLSRESWPDKILLFKHWAGLESNDASVPPIEQKGGEAGNSEEAAGPRLIQGQQSLAHDRPR
jgi:glycosyltransferase involved in cell wall biosynthesis